MNISEHTQPIDPELFEKALEAYQTAAAGEDPQIKLHEPLPEGSPPGYRLADIPINRGMMAVCRIVRGQPDSVRLSTMSRVTHYFLAVDEALKQPRFSPYLIPGIGYTNISRSFQDAFASANFKPESFDFDLDHAFSLISQSGIQR